MKFKYTHRRAGRIVSEKVMELTPEQEAARKAAEERYARSHPEAARGTISNCCGPAPGLGHGE